MITIGHASGHTIVMSSNASGDVTCAVIRDKTTGRLRLRVDQAIGSDGQIFDEWSRVADVAPATVVGVYDMAEYDLEAIECAHGLATVGQWEDIEPATVRPEWSSMRRQDFDTSEPLSLFDAPAKPVTSTGDDLFSLL